MNMSTPGQQNMLKSITKSNRDVPPNKETVIKFSSFLNKAKQQSTINDEIPQNRQHSIFQMMKANNYQMNDYITQQKNIIHELNQILSKNTPVSSIITNRKTQIFKQDPLQHYKDNIKQVLKIQSNYRRKKAQKITAKLLKNYKHRKNVIQELVMTESNYVSDLILFKKHVIPNLCSINFQQQESIKILLGNIEEIAQFNQEFLLQLTQKKITNFDYYAYIGQVLKDWAPRFKIYFDFCNNYNKSETLYKELQVQKDIFIIYYQRSNEDFQKFDIQLKKDQNLRYLGWQGFYVKPIQRVPKYVLLLNDFCKHLEKDHPLLELFKHSYQQFQEVLEENNTSMSTMTQLIKLFELQKDYGDPNQLTILDYKRFFIFEERVSILSDNQEKLVQLYALSDLLLVCEQDSKSETGYKYLKHVIFNEKSYCQSIPNKRYFSNLTKIIGKNLSLTFISETAEYKEILIQNLRKIILNLKNKNINLDDHSCKYEIEVSVIGTQERTQNLRKFTVYILDIRIDKINSHIVVRYSEIKKLYDTIVKYFPEISVSLPQFSTALWIGNHDSKVIENRKQEIEDFILSLLVNEEFQKKNAQIKEKILEKLGIDSNFYSLPEMRQSLLKSEPVTPFIRENHIQQQELRFSSIMEDPMSSTHIIRQAKDLKSSSSAERTNYSEKFRVTVIFHTNVTEQFEIPMWYRGYDLVKLVAQKINLDECCDFRLFETDKNIEKISPLIEDEIIYQFLNYGKSMTTNWLFQKKQKQILLFRKYLLLPQEYENKLLEFDNIRLQLIVAQAYYDIKNMNFLFNQEEYIMIFSHFLIINQIQLKEKKDLQWDIFKMVIPNIILKRDSKMNWIQITLEQYKILQKNNIQLLNQQQIDEILSSSKQFDNEKQIKSVISSVLLLNLIKKHPFIGMTIFEVGLSNKEFQTISNYVKSKLNKNVEREGFAISVTYSQLHFINKLKNQIYMSFQFSDFDEIRAYNDLFQVWLDDRQVEFGFITEVGFQIIKVISEYEYLEIELQKLEEQRNENISLQ